jgi:hypothetical protein
MPNLLLDYGTIFGPMTYGDTNGMYTQPSYVRPLEWEKHHIYEVIIYNKSFKI